MHISVGVCELQRKHGSPGAGAGGSWELLTWVLGTELGEPELLLTANSSAFVLNHRAVIPVLPFATKILHNSALLIGNYRGVYTIHR